MHQVHSAPAEFFLQTDYRAGNLSALVSQGADNVRFPHAILLFKENPW
jgi:hypothetical protein